MGKNKMGMILIIVLLVTLLILFAVGFGFLYKAMNKTGEQTDNNITVQQTVPIEDITPFPIGESILTNLLEGPDKKEHVIKVNVSLAINTSKETSKEAQKLLATLELQKSAIKDIIIGVCRSKTYEEMKAPDARVTLKDEILLKLQEAFGTNLIVDVYIDELFYQ